MQSQLPTSPPAALPAEFAPLPLRQRGVLETLDVAFKLFRQYWKPLIAWAAIAAFVNLIPVLNYVTFFFTPPLIIGAVCCCVAAAVRGQSVGFKQCWRFLKPRYWNVVAMHVVAGIVFFVAIVGLFLVAILAFAAVTPLFSSISDSWVNIVLGIVLFVLFFVVFGIIATALGMWQSLTAIVACMEDDPQNSGAMRRAWNLMKGQWRAVINISMILGLAVLVLWGILAGVSSAVLGMGSLRDIARGYDVFNDSNIFGFIASMMVSFYVLMLVYLPLHYLAATLLYLDFRIRKEALDLEWTAHASAPQLETAPPPTMAHSSNIFNPTAQELNVQELNAPQMPTPSVWDDAQPVAHTPAPIAPAVAPPPYSPTSPNSPRVEFAPEMPTQSNEPPIPPKDIYGAGLNFSANAPENEPNVTLRKDDDNATV